MEKFLAEDKTIKKVIGPVDLNTAANTGSRIDISKGKRVAFLVNLAAGTSTTTHTLTLKQHDAATSGNSHDLSVDNPYYHKIGAATSFTKVEPTVAAAAYDLHAILADSASLVVFEVLAEQLRSDCKWVSLDIADAGGAQLGSVVGILDAEFKPAYAEVV